MIPSLCLAHQQLQTLSVSTHHPFFCYEVLLPPSPWLIRRLDSKLPSAPLCRAFASADPSGIGLDVVAVDSVLF